MTKNRRIAYFALGICGGLAAGVGAVLEWQAVNIGGVRKIYGTDTVFGIAALVLAVLVIILTLATRKGSSEEPREWVPPLVLLLGAALAVIGGISATGASFVYDPERRSDAEKIANAAGSSVDEVLASMERFIDTRQGAGPWIVLAGGLLVVGAGLAGLAWRRAWKRSGTNGDIDGDSGATAASLEENPPLDG